MIFGRKKQNPSETRRPRALLYCASNVGLGHLFRLLRALEEMRRREPNLDALLIADRRDLIVTEGAHDLAILKLPEYVYDGDFENVPFGLGFGKSELRRIRSEIILSTAKAFRPDVVLADTAPHGKLNELEPTLKHWRGRRDRPTVALMMRDIPAPPGERFRWAGDPKRAARESGLYDHIFIAGDQKFFDATEAYQWPPEITRKLEYVGFVTPPRECHGPTECAPAAPQAEINGHEGKNGQEGRNEHKGRASNGAHGSNGSNGKGKGPRRVALSFGGGWEAAELAPRWIDAFASLSNGFETSGESEKIDFQIFTGPAMPASEFQALVGRAAGRPNIHLRRFAPDFDRVLAGADLAILQAGSTVYQILDSDIPILLYARDHSSAEQTCRAEALARLPNVSVLSRELARRGDLAKVIREALRAERSPRKSGFAFGGAARVAEVLVGDLKSRR